MKIKVQVEVQLPSPFTCLTLMVPLDHPLASLTEYWREFRTADKGLKRSLSEKEKPSSEFHVLKFGSIPNGFRLCEVHRDPLWITNQYKYKERLKLIFSKITCLRKQNTTFQSSKRP